MHGLVEKLRRKSSETLYRISNRGHSIQVHNVAHAPKPGQPTFVFRYYPYHFIQPDQIRRDFIFDANGIPIRYRNDQREYRNPLYPAYWGLIHANVYEADKSERARQIILQMSEHLIAIARTESGRLYYDFVVDHLRLDLKAPWISALTQALATSLLLRAYSITSDHRYRLAALQSARVLIMPLSKGGVVDTIEDRNPWLEEYPGTSTHVLNGCLFGLIALIECAPEDEELKTVADTVLQSVLALYPGFRVGRYLLYDLLRKHFCSPHYMGLHTLLFYHLWQSSRRDEFHRISSGIAKDTDWPLYLKSIHQSNIKEAEHWIRSQISSD